MKYITTRTEEGLEEIFIFPKNVNHSYMAEALEGIKKDEGRSWSRVFRKPIAAGFIDSNLRCHGRSQSLGLDSRPEDTALIKRQFDL